jgi:hypothetical protein
VSSSLYWRPAPTDRPAPRDLPEGLKKALANRFWGHDGSLFGDEIELDERAVPYLDGLSDGRVDGAGDLIAAIRAHGKILLWIGE